MHTTYTFILPGYKIKCVFEFENFTGEKLLYLMKPIRDGFRSDIDKGTSYEFGTLLFKIFK